MVSSSGCWWLNRLNTHPRLACKSDNFAYEKGCPSGLNYFTSSDPHHDIYTFCYWQIFCHIDTSHSLCKQAIALFFWSVTLLAGLPLHSRMSPGVTACSSGCKTSMPRHVGVHLHHWCHVACSAAWKTNMPRHVGDHLNHSCHVGCSTQTCQDTVGNHLNQWWNVTCRWGWTTNMPRHTRPPPDSRPNFWFKTKETSNAYGTTNVRKYHKEALSCNRCHTSAVMYKLSKLLLTHTDF